MAKLGVASPNLNNTPNKVIQEIPAEAEASVSAPMLRPKLWRNPFFSAPLLITHVSSLFNKKWRLGRIAFQLKLQYIKEPIDALGARSPSHRPHEWWEKLKNKDFFQHIPYDQKWMNTFIHSQFIPHLHLLCMNLSRES